MFSWYEFVWYFTAQDNERNQLGRWLGPAINLGQGLAYNVLTQQGKVVVRSTVTSLSTSEKSSPELIDAMRNFNENININIGNNSQSTIVGASLDTNRNDIYDHLFERTLYENEDLYSQEYGNYDEDGNHLITTDIDDLLSKEIPINESHNDFKGKQVNVPHDGEIKPGTIVGRKRH